MDMKPVNSSDLAYVGYDAANFVLVIEFKSGGVYQYDRVPHRVYQGLMSAPSHGKYFHANIKGQFAYHRIG